LRLYDFRGVNHSNRNSFTGYNDCGEFIFFLETFFSAKVLELSVIIESGVPRPFHVFSRAMRPIFHISRVVLIGAILFGLLSAGGCALIDRCLGKTKQILPPYSKGTDDPQSPDATVSSASETAYKPEIDHQTEQFQELSSEVVHLRGELEAKEQKIRNLDASLERQATVIIPPNAPLQYNPVIKIAGVQVLPRDGDTIRIAIDDAVLFSPNAVQLLASADEVLSTVIKEIRVNYPNNMIGIEGHADPILENPQNQMYALDFTARKANAVASRLMEQRKVTAKQIKVTGCGTAWPLPGARPEKNNRIEMVVLP